MTRRHYPDGIDCVWLAIDQDGRMGAFVTAGEGPIPVQALGSEMVPIEEIEARACALPRTGNARLLVTVPRPDDFIDMAERGFFVYDWSDIHRSMDSRTHAYELVAVPTNPLLNTSLPIDLRELVDNLQFATISFADQRSLDVTQHLNVEWIAR